MERLARLHDYGILDTGREASFDNLVALAAQVTGTSMGAISFVDRDRQWFKSTYGFEDKQTDRSVAFCAHAILEQVPSFVVPDTADDARFAGNPLVTGEPHIRFYAGVPMMTPEGLPLGSFCVMDRKPRQLDARQTKLLEHIARITMDLVEQQRHLRIMEKHVLFGSVIDSELPAVIARIASPSGVLRGVIDDLIGQYAPLLGWVGARVRQYCGGHQAGVFVVPDDLAVNQMEDVWRQLDALTQPSSSTRAGGTIETAQGAKFLYAMVPLQFSGKVLARVDFLAPEQPDRRLLELFGLLSSSFELLAGEKVRIEELQYVAEHDSLTGLSNRRLLTAEIESAIRSASSTAPEAVLFEVRLESVIEVNDNFGYDAGDEVVIEAAQRLRRLRGGSVLVARGGGNKFLVLARHADLTKDFPSLLREIEEGMAQPFHLDGNGIRLSADIGCAIFNDPSLHPIEMLRRAEVATRYAGTQETSPQRGVFVYREELFTDRRQRHHVNLQVRQAFQQRSFFLLFQPIFDLASGRMAGVETLLRLRVTDGDIIEAGTIMPAVERIRHQMAMDEWVFSEVLRLFSPGMPGAKLMEKREFMVGLNATPAFLSTEGLAEKWLNDLRRIGFDPASTVVEVVESPLLHEKEMLVANLRHLRADGVKIAIDDFGAGYSNLRHLTQLPVDFVKLDKSFVAELDGEESKARVLFKEMVRLCNDLGYRTVCEGVETAVQAAFISENGARYGQGFYYGKPVSLEEVLLLVQQSEAEVGPTPHPTSTEWPSSKSECRG
jgi:diguanylate cyclase (GGDEF)-like protein